VIFFFGVDLGHDFGIFGIEGHWVEFEIQLVGVPLGEEFVECDEVGHEAFPGLENARPDAALGER
jgi:hypothetical protein